MATYEDDHNLPASSTAEKKVYRRPRPDLSSFFSTLNIAEPSHGLGAPGLAADHIPSQAYRELATIWGQSMEGGELLETLIGQLLEEAGDGKNGKGASQEFLDGLERIPKAKLVEADICPICNTPFLLDQYPLVVRLPCHPSHAFDLECISPWLKLHTTCPLDRIDVTKRKTPPPVEDEEEEWDDNYG